MVSWQTRQYHRDRMDEYRPYLLKAGFVELTEGVFRDSKRCIDFYPSKATAYFYKEKRYTTSFYQELVRSGLDKKVIKKLTPWVMYLFERKTK